MGNFAIAFVGRVGSSYLEGLLASHPDVTCFGEFLSHPPVSEGTAVEVAAHLDRAVRNATTAVVGFKLPFCSLPLPSGILETLAARDYRFVHLQRDNKLDQFLSMRLAQVNNAWRSDIGTYAVERIHVDAGAAVVSINAFLSYETAIEEMLSGTFPYLPVCYDEVVSGEALPAILDFLGLDERPLTSGFQRQRRGSQRDSIANYEEIAAVLEDEGLGRFLTG